ncbi:MFS transporter [Pseudonocardia endophytica]|uniref:Putative MFS family arabinose efflux permease n=1 Tax=Pseudonocardia endophytica TaxID=401976 RepID=A0A4R1HIK8_PSEEN|nr:MFS transporter [Pseudonocardia endophytica]TCK20150.1 putative MFS family arabinose efflux permease [Pseudonocardia endophytica]
MARPGPPPQQNGRSDGDDGPTAFLPSEHRGPEPEDPTARIPRDGDTHAIPRDGGPDAEDPPRPSSPRIPRKLTVTRVAAYRGRQFGGWATYTFRRAATADGADRSGLTALTYATMVTYALDAAVAVALANTLFFAAATAESKTNVALYLAITVAPFAVIAPVIGPLLDRMQRGRRIAMAVSCAGRAVLAVVMALNYDNWILYPAALGAMVLSKSFLVLKAAVTPRVLPPAITLATTNSRLTTFGMVAGGVAGAVAAGVAYLFDSSGALYWTAVLGVVGTVLSMRIPRWVESTSGEVAASMRSSRRDRAPVSRAVLVALWGTSAVRVLTGFLTLFVAFVVKFAAEQAGGDPAQQLLLIGIVGAAAGAGLFLGNAVGTRIRFGASGPVVLVCAGASVAVAVLAAFLPGIATAAVAGLVGSTASAMAKVCLDAVIQRDLPEHARASAFGRSETWLQLAWVLGGALGVLLPHSTYWIGFAVVAGVIALFAAQAAAVQGGGSLVPGLGAREAPTRRPVGATRSP